MMALSGVRMSWDMLLKKSDLALVLFLAASSASWRIMVCWSCCRFLNIHVPEAEDHLVGGQLLIIEGADVHPFIDLAEAAPVVAAVVGDVLAHPLADAFQRKAQLKFLVGPRLHHLLYRGQQEVVSSRPGHLGLQIPGHLDGLIGPFAEVHR